MVILKDSALGYNITYLELLRQGQNLATYRGNLIPTLIVVAVMYILLNYALTRVAGLVERRLRRGGRVKPRPAATVVPIEETGIEEGIANPAVPQK